MNAQKRRAKPVPLREVLARNTRTLMEARLAAHGDKVKELAAIAGVSRSTVQRIVNAQFATNVDTIQAIARALKVPAHLLLVELDDD